MKHQKAYRGEDEKEAEEMESKDIPGKKLENFLQTIEKQKKKLVHEIDSNEKMHECLSSAKELN